MTETKPVALVTGASRGIGAALAVALAAEYHVILTARSEGGLTAADDAIGEAGGTATIAPLDLLDAPGVERLGEAVGARWGRLDLLVLNAATLGTLTPVAHSDPEEFDRVIALNLTANARLLRVFDPLLRRARQLGGSPAVVAITSSVAARSQPYWGPYAASKAALESLTGTYAAEMAALGFRVLVVDPGGTRTTMRARAFPGENAAELKGPEIVASAVLARLAAMDPGLGRLVLDRTGTVVS
jgi:NAD(P)-dependent dehydrogenase (short-subunit alcohol dehydrogenase family)